MCRISGGLDRGGNSLTLQVINDMRDTMISGGPDSGGTYFEEGVAMAHRRLSIIDLSDSGNQPMFFDDLIIVFNGEIYNFNEIKQLLIFDGVVFLTKTDTEVVLRAFEKWGVECVNKFRGMFAFAIYDKKKSELWLCRDRFGVKPLFWYLKDDVFLFSSEIKAFFKYPFFDKTIDTKGIPHYLMKGYFSESNCIFKYVNKVKPGHFLKIQKSDFNISTIKYWDLDKKINDSSINYLDNIELTEHLEELLVRSFSLRTVSDVPLGVFLSGGIDSSLVVSILQKKCNINLNTFTVGFDDKLYNEADIAEEIAKKLGTSHNTLICSENDFLNVIPLLPFIYDEPFGDSSAIPTYLLSKFASKQVKVALSGDGADELFGGYSKYRFVNSNLKLLNIPLAVRKVISKMIYYLPNSLVINILTNLSSNNYTQIESKFYKFRQTIDSKNLYDLFENASGYLSKKELQILTSQFYDFSHYNTDKCSREIVSYLGLLDMKSYLPGDILTKVDRASMSVGLETREPYLDPEILDFSFKLLNEQKISKNGESKVFLRRILKNYLPEEIVNRPKYGFSIPIDKWMKVHLKDDIIQMKNDLIFFELFQINKNEVAIMCENYFSNKTSYNPHVIWFLLCLYKWYKHWI